MEKYTKIKIVGKGIFIFILIMIIIMHFYQHILIGSFGYAVLVQSN
jgi:hypothetical protein